MGSDGRGSGGFVGESAVVEECLLLLMPRNGGYVRAGVRRTVRNWLPLIIANKLLCHSFAHFGAVSGDLGDATRISSGSE